MKRFLMSICFSLLLIFVASLATAQEGDAVDQYSLWMGTHYTDFQDYNKKVGEYRLMSDKLFPEFKFSQFSRRDDGIFRIDGHYFDYENINGKLTTIIGDRFKGEFQYRSLTKQRGQDLLENLETRESVGGNPGGKMITHELTDIGADYNTHRQEIKNEVSFLVSDKNNIRLIAAHRFIREEGDKQKLSSNHCFSCHLTSASSKVDKRTHSFETGIQAEVKNYDLGYLFGYRKFKSHSPEDYFYYDDARHPVHGGAGAEFGSRQIYDDVTIPVGILPETEKMSHKASFKGDLGKGRFATAFTYSKLKNQKVNYAGVSLESESYGGKLNYTAPLSRTARITAKVSGNRVKNDDPFIDLPLYRDGRSGPQVDFDYYRYSSLDRKEVDASAEVVKRLNAKTMLSVLAGYDYTMRYDYPEFESEYATKKMIGQLKVKYRDGLKFKLRGKYRFEKTSDAFTSGRGIFEARGREALQVPHPDAFRFVFYYQREALRYQDITTVPTDRHEFDLQANFRPNNETGINLGVKAVMAKNGDLDSLDVKQTSLQPHIDLTMTPNPKWTVVAGYGLNYSKSRGPVTVALFDG